MKTQSLDPTIDLGEYSHQIIQQNLQRFVDQEKAVLKDHDSEPLHQMRVGMRRLRTAVRVFEPAIVLPKTVSYSSIGKIMSSLGETRDLDVLQQILTALIVVTMADIVFSIFVVIRLNLASHLNCS